MPKMPVPPNAKSRRIRRKLAFFPSAEFYGLPWETDIDLVKLRANRAEIDEMAALWKQRLALYGNTACHPNLDVDCTVIQGLVENLALDPVVASVLVNDAALVMNWHHHPVRRALLGLNLAGDLKVMAVAARKAGDLLAILQGSEARLESLLKLLPTSDGEDIENLDVVSLGRSLSVFYHGAELVLSRARVGGGRNAEIRRNTALTLLCELASDVTGKPVRTSDGNEQNAGRHFTTETGRFVCGVMRLLGWKDEGILVGAFKRHRSAQKKRESIRRISA